MFKKIRDKITEEVQHTSLRLPVSVQQLSQVGGGAAKSHYLEEIGITMIPTLINFKLQHNTKITKKAT